MTAVHAALAVAAHVALWRGLERASFVQHGPGAEIAAAFTAAVLVASAVGSATALIVGRGAWSPARALAWDAASFAGAAWAITVMSLGPWSRDLAGIVLVAVVVMRLAPATVMFVRELRPAALAFAIALGGYAALGLWLPVASLPFGDQVHYVLVADRLAHESVATPIDARLFTELIGFPPSADDIATHVAQTPVGPRPVQGYALALAILPGWVVGGRNGVELVLALIGAWTSFVTFLILRDLWSRGALPPSNTPRAGDPGPRGALPPPSTPRSDRSVGVAWLMATALLPMPLLATHVYPNILGAAIIATAFRWGFTAVRSEVRSQVESQRRPVFAAAILALTLFLTPRDAIALVVLLPFLALDPTSEEGARGSGRIDRRVRIAAGGARVLIAAGGARVLIAAGGARVLIAAAAVLVVVALANAFLYGVPLPYASYLFGTGQAQELTKQGSITAFIWVTLPAILFDRTFGIVGTAPWAFIGLLGLVPALRSERSAVRPGGQRILLPAAVAVGASVLALSFFRLWEGGYAPPARYFVDVLPLWMPFVAWGLATAVAIGTGASSRRMVRQAIFAAALGATGVLVGSSAVASVILNGVPSLALNTAFDDKIRDAMGRTLGVDPLGWLPSFQPLTPVWWIDAYARLVPALAATAALLWLSARAGLPREAQTAGVPVGSASAEGGPARSRGFWHRSSAEPHRSSADLHRNGAELHRNGAKTRGDPERTVGTSDRPPVLGGHSDTSISVAPDRLAGSAAVGSVPDAKVVDGEIVAASAKVGMGRVILFIVLNAIATALVVFATQQPWVALGPDPVPDSLYRKWLPLALSIVAIATALIGRALAPAQRAQLFRRHYVVYLVPLALMLVARFGQGGVLNGTLGAIYLLIGIAFAVNTLTAIWRNAERVGDRSMALQLAVVALAAGLVLLPYHRAVMPTASDEPHYLLITQSLLYDRDLDVANDYAGDRYLAFYPSRLPDVHGINVGNAIYSIRDLGMPILAVIPYAIAGRNGVEALLCLVGAALAAQLYLLSRDLGFSARPSFLAAATAALTHPLFTYTTQIYPELLTALAFVSAARLIRAGTRASLPQLAAASALLGTLPWLSTRAWPIVVGAGLVLAVIALRPAWPRSRDLALRAAAGALPFAVLVLALAYVNWRMFGVFLPSAGYFLIREQQPVLTFTFWIGAPGLLFDRVFGLIPRAPIYLLAFLGAVPLIRRRRGHEAELAAIALGSILSYVYIADIAYWWADGSPPSRYFLASLPLFVVAVAAGSEILLGDALPRRWRVPARVAAALAVIASAIVVYLYGALPNIRYDLALEIASTGSPGELFTFLERAVGVNTGVLFPSLVVRTPVDVALTVAWIALCVALIAIGEVLRRDMGYHISRESRDVAAAGPRESGVEPA